MKRRMIRAGESLAINPAALHQGPEAFFWLFGPPTKRTERVGAQKDIAVVHINGPLEHRPGEGCDNYDDIIARVQCAIDGKDTASPYDAYDDEPEEETECAPPKAIVLRIDSPGGVVSGLNQTVETLRRMRLDSGIPIIAYVDEMAASAAYALCCACSEIYIPASGIAGSIGVISTMVDQTKKDSKDGYRFVTITSGDRKADGHPHVPISTDAIRIESGRVMKLANQFWNIASRARGLSVATIKSYQAGIFLGSEAVAAKVADDVMSWRQLVTALDETTDGADGTLVNDAGMAKKNGAGKNSLARVPGCAAHSSRSARPHGDRSMSLKIKAALKKAKASLVAEKDPKKREALSLKIGGYTAQLAAFKKVKHTIEKHESEEGGDEDEKAEEEEGGNETDRADDPDEDKDKDDDDSDDDSEEEDEEDEDEESEEEEEEASAEMPPMKGKEKKAAAATLAIVRKRLGSYSPGKLAALLDKAARADALEARVKSIEVDVRKRQKAAKIDEALAQRKITRHEAKTLRTKPLSFVNEFLSMRPKAIIATTEEELSQESGGRGAEASGLDADTMKEIDRAVMISAGTDSEVKREDLIAAHKARLNGVGKTY